MRKLDEDQEGAIGKLEFEHFLTGKGTVWCGVVWYGVDCGVVRCGVVLRMTHVYNVRKLRT